MSKGKEAILKLKGELPYYEKVESPEEYPFGVKGEEGREYFVVPSCCSLCEEKGAIQEGHFACRLEKVPEGFREETEAILTSSGWKKLISFPRQEEELDEFAVTFGYSNMDAVYAASDPIYEEGGLVTWFITRCADGRRFAIWDDAEIAADRVFFYETREEAEKALESAWYESHALNGDIRPKYLSCLEVLKILAEEIENDHRIHRNCNHYGDCDLVAPFVRFLETHTKTREQLEFYYENDGGTLTPGGLYDLMFYPEFVPENWISVEEIADWQKS